MNAYLTQDRIEARDWANHYRQIEREEKESELADDIEKALPLHLFESLFSEHLSRRGVSGKAIAKSFDDDVNFQERVAELRRYMAEAIASHQIDIESEE